MIPLRNLNRFLGKALRQPRYALRVLRKRLHAQLLYRRTDARAAAPEAITLFLTHRCNLHCRMCGQWGESGVTKKTHPERITEEADGALLEQLIDSVSPFGPSITLFGGEPLLYQNVLGLIRHIKEKKLHCVLITNGSLLERTAAGLLEAGLDELNVSLDAYGTLHDEIRGMNGLFERIAQGLKEISRLKKERKSAKPLVNLQCTITRYNLEALEGLLRAAEETHADSLTFHHQIFLDREALRQQRRTDEQIGGDSGDWEGFVCDPKIDPQRLMQRIHAIRARRTSFSVDFYPNFGARQMQRYYAPASYRPAQHCRCLSPWLVAYVFPDGSVRPCLNSTYSFGSLKDKPFLSVWNSPAALAYRRALRERGIFPACVRCTELYRY